MSLVTNSNSHQEQPSMDYLPEPYRIRVVEPVKRTTEQEREKYLLEAGYNPFLLDSDKVYIDLLTDSGTGSVTQAMQSAMLRGDEAYSGSRSYHELSRAVKDIFGYQFTIPTHQGRGAEQLYVPALINKRERESGLDRDKMTAISNYFFDTTQGHTQHNRCRVLNVSTPEAFNTEVVSDFKGNFDLEALALAIEEVGPSNVPYIVSTITCNSAGGQPVSIANLRSVYELAKYYGIPVVMDCARFAENAYFVKQREKEFANWSIQEITSEAFKYADIFSMSAKKDALVPIGGLLAFKDDSLLDVQLECKTLCVLLEGFPTYGGLEGGAMERLAVGLYEGMNEDWLASRVQQIEYLVSGLEALGIRCQQAGGHAAFIDAGALLPHIPSWQFPGHALSCELYKVAGIRGAEIGSLLQGCDMETGEQLPCPAEFLRLAIPRATYTQAHFDFIIAAFAEVKKRASSIVGLKFTYEPKVLRHFNAKLEPAL